MFFFMNSSFFIDTVPIHSPQDNDCFNPVFWGSWVKNQIRLVDPATNEASSRDSEASEPVKTFPDNGSIV